MTTLLQQTINGIWHKRPPVWFMRQAGRYHQHYQKIRQTNSFLDICKTPALATEVAMGPIDAFDFDVAILFSDILFPIEAMGVSLDFAPGPKLGCLLQTIDDLKNYRPVADYADFIGFQAKAVEKTRQALPDNKSLLGFIGGPLTIYTFAVEGTAKKDDFTMSLLGFKDGRFDAFMEHLIPMLLTNMQLQADFGADVVAIFDSCAGLIDFPTYHTHYLPLLCYLIKAFKATHPHTPVIYYGKGIGETHWEVLPFDDISILGVDHGQNLCHTLNNWSDKVIIQGNFPPPDMALPPQQFQQKLSEFLEDALALADDIKQKWVCGLGHGITPQAREENVKTFVQAIQQLDFSS
jgi:uroporphyrinogen decarboxylase